MIAVPSTPGVRIESFTELDQFDQCVALEEAIWGYNEADMIPRRMFLLASRIGGQVLGALLGDQVIGFAMALPAYRNGHAYLHSHMVGVLSQHRNFGVARALKLAQRNDAIARGFDLMEWTFDPLEIKNANLNITKLGAIVRRYQHDFYGPSSSPLQGGLPTDRVYAEWWLKSERVVQTLSGERHCFDIAEQVTVPADIYAWKSDEAQRQKAQSLQQHNAAALDAAFARGLTVLGYERTRNGDGHFLLGRWNESLNY